ncbi:MAG: tetraacyldisaccharide 4'-kinase, partial [Granulosicoccus sp.]|nr:tetraacyldisaccharide 4'-kinase [Granulosicoccus sp.]
HERPLLVDNTLSPEECGDEPLLIARRTGQPVCVCAERSLAVQYLLSKKNVNIVVCDDGLQHYALQRDLEIAVVDHERQHGNQRLLPAGPLREPVARLRSVDFVVESTDAAQTVQGKGYYYRRILDQVERLDGEEQRKLSTFTGSRCHAVAGIGNPQRFFAHLQGLGIELITHSFPDHHTFEAAEIAFPDKLPILMTEKDAVKCRLLSVAPERCWVVQLHAELSGNFRSAFLDKVESL